MNCLIEQMTPADWTHVRTIYLEGIRSGHSTFETEAPSWETWDAGHLPSPRLTARNGAAVVGWAALSPVSKRTVYRGVAEVSVYVAESAQGHGIGRALLEALIAASEQNGIWTLQASIFPQDTASVTLHPRRRFRQVGPRERVAKHNGVWRDTLLFERRSKTDEF